MTPTKLIKTVEKMLICSIGPPVAFFEIPQCGIGIEPVRVIYKTYRAESYSIENLNLWMLRVVTNLYSKVDEPLSRPLLYWRLPDKIRIEESEDGYILRTRFAVFDWNLNELISDNPDLMPIKEGMQNHRV